MQVIIETVEKVNDLPLNGLRMRGSRKFCQRGPTLTFYSFIFYFFFDEGREDSNTTISGPSTARQRNAIQMAFRWRADGGPTLNAGL